MRMLRTATRLFVGATGLLALGAAASVFRDPLYPTHVLYTGTTSLAGTRSTAALIGRLYAVWLLTSGSVRVVTALRYRSVACRLLSAVSYGIAFAHFYTEVFWYRTVALHPAGRLPLLVAATSLVLLILDAIVTVSFRTRGGKRGEASPPVRESGRTPKPRRLAE
ncbi:hypothetical protein F1559_002201 [Cyanidiococcus yangmingshanensis]|uniref:Ergosterol biosynthesis protein n=1 Tax=Cyanidiococcus yangmingshanensis TaxID=2690220 RepID=A0A7J7IPE4_9RHOD|nr:hypothetical protein F1559_002201 [Cyanidiococcus yangmingshanensis]